MVFAIRCLEVMVKNINFALQIIEDDTERSYYKKSTTIRR